MRMNPVLKNELKLSSRSIKFTLMILFYIGILSIVALGIFNQYIENMYFGGLNLQENASMYIVLAFIQAILLMFIVPSLSSTAICSEREKQTLDILLSSKMNTISIILGKLLSSISRVILLIICTIPVYSIILLVGGIDITNILTLSLFFIVNTIFVGSIGIVISVCLKTSKSATAITYGIVFLLFIGIVIATFVYIAYNLGKYSNVNNYQIKFPVWAFVSPTFGFLSLLQDQVGNADIVSRFFYDGGVNMDIWQHGFIISVVFQIIVSILLNLYAAFKLNPLHNKTFIKKK